ncbi:CPBP family intramembrane metalloprotease [candidate division KSB1 bacterium]|nr:CPBP family intramembrane metalloprotease [candidate division KSB1 bacterium]
MPSPQIKPIPLSQSFLYFAGFSLLLYLATSIGIPLFQSVTDLPLILGWFAMGGLVFIALFLLTLMLMKRDGFTLNWPSIQNRLRLHPLNKGDWLWVLIGIITVGAGMGAITYLFKSLGRPLATNPPFLAEYHGFDSGQEWFLLIWIVFFFFNIVGEEILWRGYLMPRQEMIHGRATWIVQGVLWTLFHMAFGPDLLIMLLPILFIQPWIVQKRKNTWIGIFIHGSINGPAFVMLSLGIL